jgi:hypothetical protein
MGNLLVGFRSPDYDIHAAGMEDAVLLALTFMNIDEQSGESRTKEQFICR